MSLQEVPNRKSIKHTGMPSGPAELSDFWSIMPGLICQAMQPGFVVLSVNDRGDTDHGTATRDNLPWNGPRKDLCAEA